MTNYNNIKSIFLRVYFVSGDSIDADPMTKEYILSQVKRYGHRDIDDHVNWFLDLLANMRNLNNFYVIQDGRKVIINPDNVTHIKYFVDE